MNTKTALVLILVLASACVFMLPASEDSADVGPFSGKAGDGEGENIRVEYYTHSNGVFKPAMYIYLEGIPAIQVSVTISTSPVQRIEPVRASSQFAVYLDQPLDIGGSPYHLMLNVFGKGDYVADCYVHVYGAYYTVTFESNGGSGTMEPVEVGSGSYVLPSCGFTPPNGRTFDCWMVKGQMYAVGDTIEVRTDTKVTAVWKEDSGATYRIGITVSPFGSGTVTGAGVYRSGETATLRASADSGHSFSGWYLNGRMVSASSPYAFTVISDAVFTAKFASSGTDTFVYSITYDANGGYDAPERQIRASSFTETTFVLSQIVPKHDGLSFKGWSESPDGQVTYAPGDTVTLYSSRPDLTLYAVWGEKSSPSAITVQYASLSIPVGSSVTLIAEVVPTGSDYGTLVWSSSDESVATVSQDGAVMALKKGTAVITVATADGAVFAKCRVTVTESGTIVGTMETEGGGSVEETLIDDDDGNAIVINPIVIVIGESGRITYDQEMLALDIALRLIARGEGPEIIVMTGFSEVAIPWTIFSVVTDNGGSLTVSEGDVTLFFSPHVLEGMVVPYTELVVCVVPVPVTDVDVDASTIPNCIIYDIHLMINGKRVSMAFAEPVIVTVYYELEKGQHPDMLYVYHLDPVPIEEVQFEYSHGVGVRFGVTHFSYYAVGCENVIGSILLWMILLVVVVLLIVLIVLFRRRGNDGTTDLPL